MSKWKNLTKLTIDTYYRNYSAPSELMYLGVP